MELKFLGRGAAFYVREGNTAACLREGDRLLLIDCGESVFGKLRLSNALNGVHEVTVLLSHLHADHCGSLGSLALYCRHGMENVDFRIALPNDEGYRAQVISLLTLTGCAEGSYRVISEEEVKGFGGFTAVKYLPTEHVTDMHCFSFEFETEKGAVFYSADTRNTHTLTEFLRRHEKIDRIYMDATAAPIGGVHASLDELCRVIAPEMRKKTFLMHFNGPDCPIIGESYGFGTVKTCVDD